MARFNALLITCLAVYFSGIGQTTGEPGRVWLAPNKPTVAVFANQSYFVSCKAPGAEKIAWIKVGEGEITPSSGKIHIEEKSDDGLDLVFETIRKKNQGEYMCKATIDGQEHEAKFTLSVFKPLSFGDTPEVQYATEGQDTVVKCDVVGDPVVTATWKVRGRSFRASPRHQLDGTNLKIKEVTLEDGGTYTCRATQSNLAISDFKEMNITLKIQHEPRWFQDHAKEAFGFLGGTVNMTCSALAEPGAEFTWIKDNKTLEPDDHVQIFNSDHHSALELHIYDESVFGDYECRATNMLGTMARVIVLEQATKPPTPSFVIKSAKADSIVLDIDESDVVSDRSQGDGHNPMDVIGYIVEFKHPHADWSVAESREYERTPSQPYTVTGLHHDSLYEVRVAARTAAGVGDFSETKMERTKKWAATAAPILNSAGLASSCVSLLIGALLAVCV